MKTTINIPDDLAQRAKILAAKRRTTLRRLVIEGLESTVSQSDAMRSSDEALERLRQGYHLGGKPLKREESHVR